MKWLAVAAALVSAGPASAASVGAWAGTYSYTYDGGATTGGSPIVQTWTLKLDERTCSLRGEGFQLDESLKCTATVTSGALAIRYLSHGDGRVVNAWGVAVYRPGQTLFTLSRQKGALLTRWDALAPDEGMARKAGAFFQKAPVRPASK